MRAIETKYLGATNFKGSRISVSAGDAPRRYYSYAGCENDAVGRMGPHDVDTNRKAHAVAVERYTAELDWEGDWRSGGTKSGFVWVNVSAERI